jgi:hypothetical protein
MSGIDSRDLSCSNLPQGAESGVDFLQGTMYDKTGFQDLNAQSYELKVNFFRGFRDDLFYHVCSFFCGQKFRFIQITNSFCNLTPCGGISRSSFPCIDVHTHEPISLHIIKVLAGNTKRKHFFPIIVRDATEFPGITPFT